MSDAGDLIDGRYRLGRCVGSGGMGIVYLATDLLTSHQVAVKVLRTTVDASDNVRARLRREIELLSRLHSPHIAELLAAGFLPDGLPYFVMELLEGRDLKAEVRRRGPLPCAEAAAYLVQTCRGIAVAHRLGIVHRDLKPHNLFLTGLAGLRKIKIVDFGVAKSLDATDPGLTATNTAVGTPLYMSPEQLIDARAISTKADVWALGVILYELLAGFSPFSDESPGAVIAAVTLDEPCPIQKLRPDVPDCVAQAIQAALVKLPSERLGTVEEFAQLLLQHATPDDCLAVPEEAAQQTAPAISRPSRTRVSAYLRDRILASIDAGSPQDRATLRCLPTASSSQDAHPLPERLSLVPGLRVLSPVLPNMISAAGHEHSRPIWWGRQHGARGIVKLSIALASLAAVVPAVIVLQYQYRQHAAKSDTVLAPIRATPILPRSTAVAQFSDASRTELPVGVTELIPTAASSATALGTTAMNRKQVSTSKTPQPQMYQSTKHEAAATVTVPAATTRQSTAKMVPKHL